MSWDMSTKEIKSLVVVLTDNVIKVGETIVSAPIGIIIDPENGELITPLEATPMDDVVLNPKIKDNILINEGFIKIKLTFTHDPCTGAKNTITKIVTVPVQSIHVWNCIRSDDIVQEKVKIKAIIVRGIPDNITASQCPGQKINLLIKVILEVKITVLREELICVPVQKCAITSACNKRHRTGRKGTLGI
ncbi:MAG TPA: hypothetical protein DER60_06550 [Syntrophomonas sp.]|jgi:hypothetical protein|nr:hypothetical protein [Syntrophomonas sp.]